MVGAAQGLCRCQRMVSPAASASVQTWALQQPGCWRPYFLVRSRCLHQRQPFTSRTRAAAVLASACPSRHTPLLPRQFRPLGASGTTCSSSSSSVLQPCRSVRCFSTPGLNPPSGPVQHISWLQDVQAWCPEPLASTSSNGSSTTSSNSSSSSNDGSSNGSKGSSTSAAAYRPPRFKQLSEAELQDPANTFDAIIVLAGGLTPDGGLPEWVNRRMDVARDLHLLQGRRPPILCSGGGTPHKPAVLGSTGHIIHESTSGTVYLMATGVQAGDILKEVASFDTVGNAYMSLCIHAIPAAWRRIAVVTSDFHMPRSRALFADLFRLAGQSIYGDPAWFSLTFVSASDEGVFDHDVYNLRLGKEAGSLAHWLQVAATLPDLAAFQQWIHAEHLCYAVPRQHEFGKRTIADQRLLDSY